MFERVRKILANYTDLPAAKIMESSTLMGDLDLNSLDIINIVMDFEDEFGIEIDDEEIRKLVTVGDIVQYMENY